MSTKEREEATATIQRHQIAAKAVKAPSQNGVVFSVPRLGVIWSIPVAMKTTTFLGRTYRDLRS